MMSSEADPLKLEKNGKCYSYVVVISQFILLDNNVLSWRPGADPGFQVRGGGAHLK
jgi:hypothetical protein